MDKLITAQTRAQKSSFKQFAQKYLPSTGMPSTDKTKLSLLQLNKQNKLVGKRVRWFSKVRNKYIYGNVTTVKNYDKDTLSVYAHWKAESDYEVFYGYMPHTRLELVDG